MFVQFFFLLRATGVPVTPTEFLTFAKALDRGIVHDVRSLYHVGRSLLVKDEKWFDAFDEAFLRAFSTTGVPGDLTADLEAALEAFSGLEGLDPAVLDDPDAREAYERLRRSRPDDLDQYYDPQAPRVPRDDQGSGAQFGQGGAGPQGSGGASSAGVRAGGASGNRMAAAVVGDRKFKNLRHDLVLDTRQFQVALKKLRELKRVGSVQELNLDKTIDETARNGGEIELVFESRKRNDLRLLLLMDVGGSMTPYANLVSRLFSAAKKSYHFREFKHYYFHNTIYEYLWEDVAQEKRVPTVKVLRELTPEWRVILVGDAAMHPYELLYRTGGLYRGEGEGYTSVEWLKRLRARFPRSVWLNPVRLGQYRAETIDQVAEIFPMYELTLEGLESAIRALV
ncbi:MAG: VWA domain-containing protein [Promethearchaeota archaeon]